MPYHGNPPSVLAWRIPGTGEPGGLPSRGLHRVGHDWSDLAAAAVHYLKIKEILLRWIPVQRKRDYEEINVEYVVKRDYFQNKLYSLFFYFFLPLFLFLSFFLFSFFSKLFWYSLVFLCCYSYRVPTDRQSLKELWSRLKAGNNSIYRMTLLCSFEGDCISLYI